MRLFIASCVFLFSLSLPAWAAEGDSMDPNQVLHTASSNTFTRLANEQSRLKSDPKYMKVIIKEELIPHFDYKYAAYTVIGTNLKNTTSEQRNKFVDAFQIYLVNAYGHILFKFDGQTIKILDNKNFKGKNIVSIPVKLYDDKNQVTQLNFKLRKNKKTGEWKIFDVIAEGISMLDTKRTEFGSLIQKKGIDEVTTLLLEKNKEFAS